MAVTLVSCPSAGPKPLNSMVFFKGGPSQPVARMISFHAAKVQTECSIYAAPAGRSSCFLSFYLTECDVSDLIIVTSVAGHASPCTALSSLLRFHAFYVQTWKGLQGRLDQPSGFPWSMTKSQKKEGNAVISKTFNKTDKENLHMRHSCQIGLYGITMIQQK